MNENLKLRRLDKMFVSGVNSIIAHQTSKEKKRGHDMNYLRVTFLSRFSVQHTI